MFQVLDTFWYYPAFSGRTNIGIVKVRDGYETKFFIGAVSGIDEKKDIEDILVRGSRFYPEELGGN